MRVDEVQILQIEPTSHCNSLCPHCPRFNFTHHDVFKSDGTLHPDLTLNHIDVDAVVKNLELHSMPLLSNVRIQGDKGDPCMHPNIDKLIDSMVLAPSGPRVMLNTNGSIRNTQWWTNLAEKNYKNFEVIFSIDGLEDTNHLYRVGIKYNTIIRNATAFITAGGYAVWKMLAFKHNEHQIEEAKTLARELGFAEFIIAPAAPRFKGLDAWPVEVNGNTHYLAVAASNIITQQFRFKRLLPRKLPIIENKEKICPNLVRGHIYITHQNYIIPCCMMHFDTELKYIGTDQLRELTEGFERHDISKLPLSVIFNQPFFKNKLLDSFKTGNLQYTCEKLCKSQIKYNLEKLT